MKPKKGPGFFTKILLFINFLLALALLLSYLAPVTNPVKTWIIPFLGLGYPPLLLANLIFIVFWTISRRWYALLSVVAILVGLKPLQNTIGFNEARTYKQKISPQAIRVMTYNVHNFKRFGAKNDVSTKHEILDIISQYQPDVLGIQEFYTKFRGEYAMRDSIKYFLHANMYFEAVNYNTPYDAAGMAIFTKYKIINQGLIWLSDPGNGNQCLFTDLVNKRDTFRFYSIHLKSIGFDQEDYQSMDNAPKGKTDMHSYRRIAGKLKQAFIKRSKQVAIIKAHAAKCPYPYIISGDFNDTPSSYAVHTIGTGMKNAFFEKGSGLGKTYNGDFPNYQIDYIFTTKQFSVRNYQVIERKLSDHYPVYSDLLLK